MKAKISEIFRSFQGEGKYTGWPAIFVRFFGCNLSCNFGGKTEPQQIDKLEDFKVPERGCDSGYAWQKEYKHLAVDYTPEELIEKIFSLVPNGLSEDFVLVFTGGEPLLYQDFILEVLRGLNESNVEGVFSHIIFETNGTIQLTDEFVGWNIWQENYLYHFSISPKLHSVSRQTKSINKDALKSLIFDADEYILKFVVDGSDEAWKELEEFENEMNFGYDKIHSKIYIMPLGGTKDQQMNIENIVQEAINRGYKISLRTHCYVFANKIGS